MGEHIAAADRAEWALELADDLDVLDVALCLYHGRNVGGAVQDAGWGGVKRDEGLGAGARRGSIESEEFVDDVVLGTVENA